MSDTDSKWKRSKPSRIYDYNYKVSEGYYKPQTDYLDSRIRSREDQPPADTHLTYAERFANRPWYGGTRGLPYSEHLAESNKPLLKPSQRQRGSSLIREMKEDEKDDIPLHIRAQRRKKRMEEEEEELGIRAKPTSRSAIAPSGSAFSKYESKNESRPSYHSSELHNDIKRFDSEMNRSLDRARRSVSVTSDGLSTYSRDPVKRSSRHEESYSLPSGTRVKKLSQTDSYQSSSSYTRPPVSPRPRNFSFNDEASSSVISRPRSRVNSFSGDILPSVSRSYRHSSVTSEDDDLPFYNNRAAKLREERKQRESEALTDNIHKMVEKMRVREIDPSAAYSHRQNLRASSSERDESRYRSKNRANIHSFVYGVGRA